MKTIQETSIQHAGDAVERLLEVSERGTEQSRIAANFLLAWWNAGECGGFDLTELWTVDTAIAEDMITVFTILPYWQHYPDSPELGFGERFEKLASAWRPDKGSLRLGLPLEQQPCQVHRENKSEMQSRGQGQSPETPTEQMTRAIEKAYDHFNRRLFAGELPPLLLKLSPSSGKTEMVFLVPETWRGPSGYVCELSLPPGGSSRGAEEVFSTLVHEMAHYLDHIRGVKPKSPGYHGKRWFATMTRIGLPPKPHGKSSMKVAHEIAPNGAFLKAFEQLPADVRLPFVSLEYGGEK